MINKRKLSSAAEKFVLLHIFYTVTRKTAAKTKTYKRLFVCLFLFQSKVCLRLSLCFLRENVFPNFLKLFVMLFELLVLLRLVELPTLISSPERSPGVVVPIVFRGGTTSPSSSSSLSSSILFFVVYPAVPFPLFLPYTTSTALSLFSLVVKLTLFPSPASAVCQSSPSCIHMSVTYAPVDSAPFLSSTSHVRLRSSLSNENSALPNNSSDPLLFSSYTSARRMSLTGSTSENTCASFQVGMVSSFTVAVLHFAAD
mmetsp:Transcript_42562/g.72599  ORF Transcript_42562/g.72599 Transcript_42562/m.72599 type:complete len:256 (-) Transcript_42562:192-959(-)